MAYESKYNIDRSTIFKETFSSEQDVLKVNSGVSTNVVFANGTATFNGTSSKIENNINVLRPNTSKVTFHTKFKPLAYDASVGDVIFGRYNVSVDSFTHYLMFLNGRVRIAFFTNTGNYIFFQTQDVVLTLNEWATVVCTADLSTQTGTIYINGESVTVTTTIVGTPPSAFISSTNKYRFGILTSATPVDYYANFEIDYLEIYNRVLTGGEASNLYNNTSYRLVNDSKVFELNTIDGNLNDKVSKDLLVNTDVVLKQTEKGLVGLFNGTTSKLDTNKVYLNGATSLTLVSVFKTNIAHNGRIITDALATGNNFFTMMLSTGKIRFQVEASFVDTTNTWNDNKFHLLVCTYDGANLNIYIDNQLEGTVAGTPTLTTVLDVFIGARDDNTFFNGYLGRQIIYDNAISENERSTLYNEFLSQRSLAVQKHLPDNSIPSSVLNAELAYNMIVKSNTVKDISPNNFIGTLDGAVATSDGVLFDGINDRITFSGYTNVYPATVNVVCKSTSTNAQLPIIASNIGTGLGLYVNYNGDALIYLGGGNYRYFTIPNNEHKDGNWHQWTFVITGNAQTDILNSKLYLDGVELVTSTTVSSAAVDTTNYSNIGYSVTSKYGGTIRDFRIYNATLPKNSINKLYKELVAPYTFIDKPIYEKADGTNIHPLGYIAGTGSYKVGTDTDNSQYYECTSDGLMSFPSKQAYGTWEFDIYKGTDASTTILYFINSNTSNNGNGYVFYFNSQESIVFGKITAGTFTTLWNTSISRVALNTWYTIKVTRTQTNIFTMYIKGGAYGNEYTLVGSLEVGTNPITDSSFTTSNFTTLNLDAGDRVKNIKYSKGIV